MIKVDITNIEEAKRFVISNLKRSGFTYGNLSDPSSETYILRENGAIIAMANNLNHQYVTYLFPEQTDTRTVRQVVEFMQDKEHIGGTVTGNYYDIFKEYYKLPVNAINEVASLQVQTNNYKSEWAQILTSADIPAYKQSLDTISQFQKRDLASVTESFKRSVTVGIKRDGKIVSAASLTAISDVTAVVTTVFTISGEEGKGYAKDCLHRLLADYASGRTILIFFTNPVAKGLYLSLGFAVDDSLLMYNQKLCDLK